MITLSIPAGPYGEDHGYYLHIVSTVLKARGEEVAVDLTEYSGDIIGERVRLDYRRPISFKAMQPDYCHQSGLMFSAAGAAWNDFGLEYIAILDPGGGEERHARLWEEILREVIFPVDLQAQRRDAAFGAGLLLRRTAAPFAENRLLAVDIAGIRLTEEIQHQLRKLSRFAVPEFTPERRFTS